ncbi:hypothetical protein TKK_0001786 [Trichogramma kaykai]
MVHNVITLKTMGFLEKRKIKLIIDTDAGGDDAVAIMMALKAHKQVEVLAITCTYGNTYVENVAKNVLKILAEAERTDIPVYRGAQRPLMEKFNATTYFGEDGFGDFQFDKNLTQTIDETMPAALAMIELTKKYPGEISILTIGPLTNAAQATLLDPNFAKRVKQFYSMGSRVTGSADRNGRPLQADFNFGLDPLSDAIFFNNTRQTKISILPGMAIRKHIISVKWRREEFGRINSTAVEFLNKAEKLALDKWARFDKWPPTDSVTLAVAVWPKDIVKTSSQGRMLAITCGPSKGLVNFVKNDSEGSNNIELVDDYDPVFFKKKLVDLFS